MVKQNISKNTDINISGVLNINNNKIYIEVEDGPVVCLKTLIEEFDGKVIKIMISHNEDYEKILIK